MTATSSIDDEASISELTKVVNSESLLDILDNIKPTDLGSTTYSKYVKKLTKIIKNFIEIDGTLLLTLVQCIKECKKPCYKRDILIELLEKLIFPENDSSPGILSSILSNAFKETSTKNVWKELSSCIVSLPDLVANCGLLGKFIRFKSDFFYELILISLLTTIRQNYRTVLVGHQSENRLHFYLMILGKIAIAGYTQLVWDKFTSKVIEDKNNDFKEVVGNILRFPLMTNCDTSIHFEHFIEPLYIPIFFNLKPSQEGGRKIQSILGEEILSNETFEYILCNKSILQTNYTLNRRRQNVILFNIFSYLSSLATSATNEKYLPNTIHKKQLQTARQEQSIECDEIKGEARRSSLLVKTLIAIAQNWSNNTKILFRTHDHNRYISYAFAVALRYALECDRLCLINYAEEIQTEIMTGFSVYLDRASLKQRNLAMCLGEILLPKLHQLIDTDRNSREGRDENLNLSKELKFDVDWDEDCLEVKKLFSAKLDEIFIDDKSNQESNSNPSSSTPKDSSSLTISKDIENPSKKAPVVVSKLTGNQKSKKALVVELDDEDDLVPYKLSDEENDSGGEEDIEDTSNVPIYLRDCLNGLIENNKPRYVKLCLIKTCELVEQLSKQEINVNLTKYKPNQAQQIPPLPDTQINDAIKDIAIEFAQILLYLDDQFNIEEFDVLRLKALSSLCSAAPDLVVKYLLDEYNGDNRNIRHQLDTLQVLVSSAKDLSSTNDKSKDNGLGFKRSNAFAKYASLYFYGIVHRLKTAQSNGIISIGHKHRQWLDIKEIGNEERMFVGMNNDGKMKNNNKIEDKNLDDSYLLSRILFSISLLIKCLYQQPITCKLSSDLVDILAAYRCHPDIGVREAIINCLTIVRDYTPSVYFKEYLEDKIINLFGPMISLFSQHQ